MLSRPPVTNIVTVDVEDWFHVLYAARYIALEDGATELSCVKPGVMRLLAMLEEAQVTCTFFILGLVAQRYPNVVREIQRNGHEVATHGYAHKLVYQQTPTEFREDLLRSIRLLEDITGTCVEGYRAPVGSLNHHTQWAFDIMLEAELTYDSSIYPTSMLVFSGMSDTPRQMWQVRPGLWEIPLSVARFGKFDIPLSGGFYLRTLPFWFFRLCILRENAAGRPVVLYVHPWEIALHYPRVIRQPHHRFIQYFNLKSVMPKLRSLLQDFSFSSVHSFLERSRHLNLVKGQGGNENDNG